MKLMQKYPANVRQFSLNLHFHSPRAYEFVRATFDDNLPHNSTLRRWYANSDLFTEPGITTKSLEVIKTKVAEKKEVGEELVVSVCFDEMKVRKHITWDSCLKQMRGYVSYGCKDEDDKLEANEAIVFMVSGLNDKFRIPIAYHFINSLDASQKSELVRLILNALLETGVMIAGLTFDGHPTNKKTCKILGANLNVFDPTFQPYFLMNNQKINIFLDVCHAEKLVRGWFDKKGVLIDIDGNEIKWSYIEKLVQFSQGGLSTMHKLNQSHINWRRRPMNVRIAVETLSQSTAESIDFYRSKGYKDFEGSMPTSTFVRIFDNLFNVFNSKLILSQNEYKSALHDSNKQTVFTFLDEAVNYIKNLKYKGETGEVVNMCRSGARTGFIGFIWNIYSLKSIYKEYVEEKQNLSFIPTYYLNQDAVEIFFGKVRSLGGHNDNPNDIQFTAAYKKLLGNDSILISRKGNCAPLLESNENPFSSILYVSSKRDKCVQKTDDETEIIVSQELEILHEKLNKVNSTAQSELTEKLKPYMIGHIASVIEEKIKISSHCQKCINVIEASEKVHDTFSSPRHQQKPCISTYKICSAADQYLKLQLLKGDIHFQTIYYSILNEIDIENMYQVGDFTQHEDHRLHLIRCVVDGFIQIKGIFMARKATQNLHSKMHRHILKKLIHFYNQ